MNISVICVGRLKEKYWVLAVDEYLKRLSRYVKAEIIEIPDEKAPESLSAAEADNIKKREGEKIIRAVKEGSFVVALAIEGNQLSSEELAGFISKSMTNGISHITFIIGGSLGLSSEVMRLARLHLSFSKMTFPHQMMRIVLLEQVYRAFKIINNEPYHK